MRRGLKATTITLGLLLTAISVCAQTNPPAAKPPEEEFQNEEDPTRAVFLSVRNELFNLQDGAWINAVTLRKDQALFKKRGWLGGKVGILTRFDLPQVTSHLGGATHAGLGDVYGQVVYVPWLTPRFALATGSGMTFPTATDKTLGGGQWRIAPLIAPVWYLPPKKGFFLVKFQQFVSFAGDRDRPDSTFLLTTPQLLYRFRRRWWLLADTEMKTDWERDNHASFRSGFGIGRIVSSRYGLLIKPEVPWGGHREGDWTLRISLTRYRSQ